MSGHSKWNTIKRKKAANDAARGKLFAKMIRAVEVAAREGGNDPAANATLADAIQRARDNSVPKDTIERAAKRGAGDLDGVDYQHIQYEGYAPGGVAVLADCLTDNRNRTAADVRQAFTKAGGNLADPGSVAYLFSRRGQVVLTAPVDEDELLEAGLEAGLEDVEHGDDQVIAWCDPTGVRALRSALESAGFTIAEASSTMVPSVTVAVGDAKDARKIIALIDQLDESDDVQDVYANFDIPDEVLQEVASSE